MRFISIGTRAASPLRRTEAPDTGKSSDDPRSGFTLVEALVALALVLGFAATLGPLMFQSQRILVQGDNEIKAALFLRSLLDTAFDRTNPALGTQWGKEADMRWRLDVVLFAPNDDDVTPREPKKDEIVWGLFRITAHVFWGDHQSVTAQTLQLGRVN